MKKIILKILNKILNFQENQHNKKIKKVLKTNGTKTLMTKNDNLEIKNVLIDNLKHKLLGEIEPIIKENIKTPDKLLDYVKNNGTNVFKIKNADKILSLIDEVEGFITPLSGFSALYINLILNKKISFKTDEMFILRDLPVNKYFMIYQFYVWKAYKINMPGYDRHTQNKFKHVFKYENDRYSSKLNYEELINLKEAIARDKEAIDFVINLAKEYDGAKNKLNDIKKDGEADI